MINEEYSEFLSRLTTEEQPPKNDGVAQEELPIDEDESDTEDSVESEQSESVEPDGESDNHPPESSEGTAKIEMTEGTVDGNADLTIEIEISSEDWDSEEVISVIESVKGTASE
ncbi:hypothetical protein [Halorubrum sp. Boch-26]|uniref:hypothetical protein n=1 Tax=Halorubrum sp. Boch-26 TaxID=2994426 RepID=UPI002469AE56|nr:hypothetical protein [Halorubrum sp. Boch-26]